MANEEFAKYDGQRIAVALPSPRCTVVISGIARFCNDALLGPGLRIMPALAGHPSDVEVIITEDGWNGQIVSGARYGCDYCFIPASM